MKRKIVTLLRDFMDFCMEFGRMLQIRQKLCLIAKTILHPTETTVRDAQKKAKNLVNLFYCE